MRKREGGTGANSNADEDGALEAQVASEFGIASRCRFSVAALLPELLTIFSAACAATVTRVQMAWRTSTAVDGEGEPKGDDGEGDASDEEAEEVEEVGVLEVDDQGAAAEFRIQPVLIARHVATRSAPAAATTRNVASQQPQLHVPAIVATLARLFDQQSLNRPPPPPSTTAIMSAAEHLVACFRDVASRLSDNDAPPPNVIRVYERTDNDSAADNDGAVAYVGWTAANTVCAGGDAAESAAQKRRRGSAKPLSSHALQTMPTAASTPVASFEPWVTLSHWEAYLEDRHDLLELPPNSLARALRPLAAELEERSFAITHAANGHAAIRIAAELRGKPPAAPVRRVWHPATPDSVSSAGSSGAARGFGVRFPFFPPLLEAIEAPLAQGLPAQWWLGDVDNGKAAMGHPTAGGHKMAGGAASVAADRTASDAVDVTLCVARGESSGAAPISAAASRARGQPDELGLRMAARGRCLARALLSR